MMKTWRTIILTGCSFLSIGCIVKPAADTILTAEMNTEKGVEKFTFGVSDVQFYLQGNEYEILGLGSHPREHETYAYFACEPSFDMPIRCLRMTSRCYSPDPQQPCRLEFLVDTTLFRFKPNKREYLYFAGPCPEARKNWLGDMVIELKNVHLKRVDSKTQPQEIILSGTIVAKKEGLSRYSFDHGWKEGMSNLK